MRSVKLVAVVTLLAGTVAFGASQIVYTLELGGNNHADLWEANQSPSFTRGVTTDTKTVEQEKDITWAVRVSVGGTHVGNPGDGFVPYGAANLVFDIELYDATGTNLVAGFGAATLVAQGAQNEPSTGGFWSSINDGDTAGSRGAIAPDALANAAFAIGIRNNTDPATSDDTTGQMYALHDAAPNGPNFDYGWYPTANGRGGVDIAGTKPISTAVTGLDGKLVGFGAGYKSYDYTSYRPGVGVAYLTANSADIGFGKTVDRLYASDPLAAGVADAERVVFEGQINTTGLPVGTYTLKVVPSVDGNNILHGAVSWNNATPDYGGFGSFAAKANEVYPTVANNPGVKFSVTPKIVPTGIAARKIFYNQSFYDGNKVAIDAAPIAGANNDDADAIDTSKSALVSGTATFANWTGYNKGINGLIYDINVPSRAPVQGDFTFLDIGKAGTAAGTAKTPSGFVVIAGGGVGGSTRVIVTFANNAIQNTWLKVVIGTGFGLTAADTHYWGNAVGETGVGNTSPNATVNAQDEVMCRAPYLHNAFSRALVDDASDLNKDSLVNANDEVLCRTPYVTNAFNCVKMITK